MDDETSAVSLLTADPVLGSAVARLAAAAGAGLTCFADPEALMTAWTAPVVLIGADRLAAVAALAPPRRDRVFVVNDGQRAVALEQVLGCGAEAVYDLPDQDEDLVVRLTDIGRLAPAVTVGIVGGAGGSGASTFATALALHCARAEPTVLIDADVLGAGVDQVLALNPDEGIRWDDVLTSRGRLSGTALRDALPRRDGASVLAWPVDRLASETAGGAREVIAAAVRGFATVIVDLPRGSQPVADELIRRCERIVVVTVATVPGLVATARITRRLPTPDPVLVVRRRHGGVEPTEAARFLGIDSVVAMTDQRGLDEDVALGAGPLRRSRGPLARAAADVASLIGAGR